MAHFAPKFEPQILIPAKEENSYSKSYKDGTGERICEVTLLLDFTKKEVLNQTLQLQEASWEDTKGFKSPDSCEIKWYLTSIVRTSSTSVPQGASSQVYLGGLFSESP